MSNATAYPSISVIVPTFNQGQFIEQTLQSIVNQQYPNLEILVLDGGSTDGTIDIIKKYSSYLSYWHSKKDDGQADAINQGINLSSGDIVCWLNSDDLYLPGTLLEVGSKFCERTNQNYLIYGDAKFLYEGGRHRRARRFQYAAPFDPFLLTYYDYIVQPSAFWTRKLWQQAGDLDPDCGYVLDWEWFIRATKIAEFEYVHKFYSVYRIHSAHKTHNGGAKRRKEVVEVVKKYSSDYWSNLYLEVEASHVEIKKKAETFEYFESSQ